MIVKVLRYVGEQVPSGLINGSMGDDILSSQFIIAHECFSLGRIKEWHHYVPCVQEERLSLPRHGTLGGKGFSAKAG